MPRPTKEQLEKINKFSQAKLEEDQVYVFSSLSADTLPVARYSWFGRYDILMTSKMLDDLKKSYQVGVGLLASHNNNRLPFGRTFDANVKMDYVDNSPVETLYIDHYVVTHLKDEDGNKVPLRTEVNGMTTQDIVNHIDVGHTFDTSIGFAINLPKCSICKNDIRDHENCSHIPGLKYDVQVGDKTEKVRCDILADGGEGLENSLVYAGAVDRALIQRNNYSKGTVATTEDSLQSGVNSGETTLYNVEEIKNLPMNSLIFCRMSKGNMDMFTNTTERIKFEARGEDGMSTNNQTELTPIQFSQSDFVSLEEYNKVVSEKEAFSQKVTAFETKVQEFETKVAELTQELTSTKEELTAKSELTQKFTEDLISETVKAGVKARGNTFNADRFEKYLRSLSVDEVKEELAALKEEFSAPIEDARVTELQVDEGSNEETVNLSKAEMRQLAAKNAMEIYKTKGGNLEELTKSELAKLQSESK